MDGWLERVRTVNISRRSFIRVAAKYLAAGGALAAAGPFITGCQPAAPAAPYRSPKGACDNLWRSPGNDGPSEPHQHLRRKPAW